MDDSSSLLAAALTIYVVFLFAIALWIRRSVHTAEDFLVAGRRLSFPLATGTILATWVGAGTILATVDEVRSDGLKGLGLEPIGPGVCLLLTALFFARPLWNARLLTANDLYRKRFGRYAEWISTLYTVSYFPWIAAILLGAAGILTTFFGIDIRIGVVLVALVAVGYTLLGGMWSVTLTDAFQLVLLLAGLMVLSYEILSEMGAGDLTVGIQNTLKSIPEEERAVVPLGSLREFHQWLGLFLAGSIGLIASQDILQRVFSARSARVAAWSCGVAGGLYLLIGCLPVLLGLASRTLIDPEIDSHVTAVMAKAFMSPTMRVVFVLGITSAILSTIDSAILAPSSVLAQNLLRHAVGDKVSVVTLTKVCIVLVSLIGVGFALSGERAFQHLEASYSVGIAIFVVLFFAVYQRSATHPLPAILVLLLGLLTWAVEQATGWQGFSSHGKPTADESLALIPVPVFTLLFSFVLYGLAHFCSHRRKRPITIGLGMTLFFYSTLP